MEDLLLFKVVLVLDADKQPSERDDFFLGVRCNSISMDIAVPSTHFILIFIIICGG